MCKDEEYQNYSFLININTKDTLILYAGPPGSGGRRYREKVITQIEYQYPHYANRIARSIQCCIISAE
jgi:hypothetical protein